MAHIKIQWTSKRLAPLYHVNNANAAKNLISLFAVSYGLLLDQKFMACSWSLWEGNEQQLFAMEVINAL